MAIRLRAGPLRDIDFLWINDPVVGVHCLGRVPALYDVTDDWREVAPPGRLRRRLIAAEDRLAREVTTVVCSPVLQERWQQRYGVAAHLVQNGVDLAAHRTAVPHELAGVPPHVGYVGSLHQQRLDLDLVLALARDPRIGTVHLVGPDYFDARARDRLATVRNLLLHGPVPSEQVPGWMASLDVLVSPHLVDDFTMSLDAIKAYEYLASGRPIVATPTSGFQRLADAVRLATGDEFVEQVVAAAAKGAPEEHGQVPASWDDRAAEMAQVLQELVS